MQRQQDWFQDTESKRDPLVKSLFVRGSEDIDEELLGTVTVVSIV